MLNISWILSQIEIRVFCHELKITVCIWRIHNMQIVKRKTSIGLTGITDETIGVIEHVLGCRKDCSKKKTLTDVKKKNEEETFPTVTLLKICLSIFRFIPCDLLLLRLSRLLVDFTRSWVILTYTSRVNTFRNFVTKLYYMYFVLVFFYVFTCVLSVS